MTKRSVFGGVCIPRSLVFCVVFRISLFVTFLVAITLSVFFRLTTFEHPFGIFKHFLIVLLILQLITFCSKRSYVVFLQYVSMANLGTFSGCSIADGAYLT
jgi:glucan phosphoethanolaminetransferase (alkaline phosphatase superfamily)